MAHTFEIGRNKMKLLMEYDRGSQKVLSGSAVLAALTSGRIYIITQNGRSRFENYRPRKTRQYF
jgi:hypothetical protein